MIELMMKTIVDAPDSDRQAVLFVCHPNDLDPNDPDNYLQKICKMLWKYVDCAVYYPKHPETRFSGKDCKELLENIVLAVIPVTRSLLKDDCGAVDIFRAAKEMNKPVIPILYESDPEGYEAKFGNTQYLDPVMRDLTGIRFEKKLEKRLFEVLIDRTTVDKVCGAFDARVFLSYRKKDRAAADELIRRIHSAGEPDLRGVAIWYDEDLTPGEDFEENISDRLIGCDLFVLTVTNALLEKNCKGETNYVAAMEYPAALRAGKPIVPVMAEKVDLSKLETAFGGVFKSLPQCPDMSDTTAIKESVNAVLENLDKHVRSENDRDPEQLYHIGLGYLLGVCVERNREYGEELLEKAAARKHIGAMKKLRDMYRDGENAKRDYDRARTWAEACVEALESDPDQEQYFEALTALAHIYVLCEGKWLEKACERYEQILSLRSRLKNADAEDAAKAMLNLAVVYRKLKPPKEALIIQEKLYDDLCEMLSEENGTAPAALVSLAEAYRNLGEYEIDCGDSESARKHFEQSVVLADRAYRRLCDSLGSVPWVTVRFYAPIALSTFAHALENLAQVREEQGENGQALLEKALKTLKAAYLYIEEKDRDTDPAALTILLLEASIYHSMKKSNKTAVKMAEKVYNQRCSVLGETHPATMNALHVWAVFCKDSCKDGKEYQKAVELFEKCYQQRKGTSGETDRETLRVLGNLALAYKEWGDREKKREQKIACYKKALELMTECCGLYEKEYGKDDPETKRANKNLDMAKAIYLPYSGKGQGGAGAL